MASKAAKSKPSKELRGLKQQLEKLAADVLEGHVEKGDAVAVNQIWNTIARLIELERKVREEEELTGRIEALEQMSRAQGGNLWRA